MEGGKVLENDVFCVNTDIFSVYSFKQLIKVDNTRYPDRKYNIAL